MGSKGNVSHCTPAPHPKHASANGQAVHSPSCPCRPPPTCSTASSLWIQASDLRSARASSGTYLPGCRAGQGMSEQQV